MSLRRVDPSVRVNSALAFSDDGITREMRPSIRARSGRTGPVSAVSYRPKSSTCTERICYIWRSAISAGGTSSSRRKMGLSGSWKRMKRMC